MNPVRDLELASTLLLCGLIWVVQLVHYPSFGYVAREEFARFHAFHSRRITLLVAALMPVELVTATLAARADPSALPLLGLALVALIWVSTALLQVPAHRKLAAGYDADVHRRLVRTNWIRTAAWTARAVLVVAALP